MIPLVISKVIRPPLGQPTNTVAKIIPGIMILIFFIRLIVRLVKIHLVNVFKHPIKISKRKIMLK